MGSGSEGEARLMEEMPSSSARRESLEGEPKLFTMTFMEELWRAVRPSIAEALSMTTARE